MKKNLQIKNGNLKSKKNLNMNFSKNIKGGATGTGKNIITGSHFQGFECEILNFNKRYTPESSNISTFTIKTLIINPSEKKI